ncbi:hypothetical protein FALBO_7804 [Fusarium albosuccineum]|uniref:Protein kinase domain-containing protein n=1 Tax=Fusarium albosuccineum TaxID=1237068 RepID=A0A8H4P7J5_9HYPO|nr:hypothetical protein FALBO_7804 [Fusarium albosuccineum]
MSPSDTRRDTLLEYCFAPRGDSFQRAREPPGGREPPITTTATASSAIKGTPPIPPIHRPERRKEPPKKVTFLDNIKEVPRPEPTRFGQREYDGGGVLERRQSIVPQKKSGRNALSLDHNVEPEEVLEHHLWRPKAAAEDKYRSGVLTWETADSNQVSMIKGISHDNILKFLDVYAPSDGFNVAFEFLPVSLKEVAMSHMLEGEQMAAIMKQGGGTTAAIAMAAFL